MELFWYIMIVMILTVYFVLDGYDFGVGIIHLLHAKTEKDRKLIAKSAGLFWDSNEVWLVVVGGMLFMAFPKFYASAFSGFYLPLILILWLIIFRAIGLELRGQFGFPMWKRIWDRSFGISSFLMALFFGIALGNVVRGVNLGGVHDGVSAYEPHYFFLPLWDSSFSPVTTHPGVIDWFTIVIGIISVLTLAIHGANWIILKTNSSINEKLKTVIFKYNILLSALTVLSLFLWKVVKPHCFDNFFDKPYLFVFPMIYLTGLVGMYSIKKFKKEVTGFYFSCALVIGGITSSLVSMFPVLLPSTNNVNEDLTIYNTSTTDYAYSIAIVWGVIGFILMVVYAVLQARLTSGKVDDMDYGH